MKKTTIIVFSLLFLVFGCSKEEKQNYEKLFHYLNYKNIDTLNFGNFFVVQREQSNQYFFKNTDFGVEYIFSLTEDSIKSFSYYKDVKSRSDKFLEENFQDDQLKIKSKIEKTITFCALVLYRFNLQAISGRSNNKGKLLDFSFRDNIILIYFSEPSQVYVTEENIIKKYTENWYLVHN